MRKMKDSDLSWIDEIPHIDRSNAKTRRIIRPLVKREFMIKNNINSLGLGEFRKIFLYHADTPVLVRHIFYGLTIAGIANCNSSQKILIDWQ